MKAVRFTTQILIVFATAGPFFALPVHAQDPTPVPTGICAGGGRPAGPCTPISSGPPAYSGPTAEETEAEKEREAEKKRLEELQQQMEQERLRRETEQKRAQEEFLRQVNEAVGQLKGVSHGDMGLKGVEDNDFFGLKGVSPDVAAGNINTSRPDRSARDVSTASKRLTCANSISTYMLKRFSNVVAGAGTPADLDEIKYLAGEASNALQGDPVGVQCNSSGALQFSNATDLKAIAPAYEAGLNKMVRDSQSLYQTGQQLAAAQQKIDDAKKQLADVKTQRAALSGQPPASSQAAPKSTGDAQVDKAYAEQKAWQQKDQEKIHQVYEEQKKLQQQQFDALALLRKAQAELNAVNSQKLAETRAATQDVKQLEALESGRVSQ